jgi:hypothetical protein
MRRDEGGLISAKVWQRVSMEEMIQEELEGKEKHQQKELLRYQKMAVCFGEQHGHCAQLR